MRPSTLTLTLLLLLIALISATTLSQSKRVEPPSEAPSKAPVVAVGGWFQIKNLSDPEVVEIAQFAVSEYNKEANTKLELGTVVSGEMQAVNGFNNYRLLISTKNISPNGSYTVEVWSFHKTKKLLYFTNIAN